MYLHVRSGSSVSGLLLSFIKFVYFLLPNWFISVFMLISFEVGKAYNISYASEASRV
jgi:hypothetical protein